MPHCLFPSKTSRTWLDIRVPSNEKSSLNIPSRLEQIATGTYCFKLKNGGPPTANEYRALTSGTNNSLQWLHMCTLKAPSHHLVPASVGRIHCGRPYSYSSYSEARSSRSELWAASSSRQHCHVAQKGNHTTLKCGDIMHWAECRTANGTALSCREKKVEGEYVKKI